MIWRKSVSGSKDKRKIKIVEVSGDSYEMGFQYGVACPEIGKMLDITYQVFGGKDKAGMLADKYIPLYLPYAEKYAPEIVDEMRGMAAGAKLDFQDIFFLNITYEISVPTAMGCTSFAAAGKAAGNGEVITGQNFDFLSMWEEIIVLLKMKPTHGPEILAVAPAGSLGLLGLNSAGISLNLNLLRNKDSLMLNGGVPAHIILRKLLTCENIGEAVGVIASAEMRSAKNYILASEQGDVVDVEVTMNDLDVHYPERGILTHANCFKTDRFKSADLAPLFWPDSFIRGQRLYQLMENQHGQLSVDVMKQLLQDHNNHPNSICRHPDPGAPLPIGRMIKTLFSFISYPKERKVFIALGNPCENEYAEYQL
jgi:isopenicillin-N N-acyltransferase-like protein